MPVVLPVTVLGLKINELIMAGSRTMGPLCVLLPRVAITVRGSGNATPTSGVAVNVVVFCPAVTVAVLGTFRDVGSLLINVTVIPPAGAAWLIVTVPVGYGVAPSVAKVGLKLTDITEIEGTTVTVWLTVVVPVVAITVTLMEPVTVPAITAKVSEFAPAGTTCGDATGNTL